MSYQNALSILQIYPKHKVLLNAGTCISHLSDITSMFQLLNAGNTLKNNKRTRVKVLWMSLVCPDQQMQTDQGIFHPRSTKAECLVSCTASSRVGPDQDQMPKRPCCARQLSTAKTDNNQRMQSHSILTRTKKPS